MKRSCGVLLPISALSSPHGIGTLGKAAYDFVDFLAAAGQAWWQLLPVGPTSYGDSPYQSFSTYAGNPYFIDLDLLCEDGLLQPAELTLDWGADPARVDAAACISCMRCIAVCPHGAREGDAESLAAITAMLRRAYTSRKENELFL